jgi:acetolactate decarboxylase
MDLALDSELMARLERRSRATGTTPQLLIEQSLRRQLEAEARHNSVYISTPINALVEGIYQENTTIADIKAHGDFGLGTFDQLDGEMVVLDGRVYQLKADGHSYPVADEEKTPFACVTFFSPDSGEDVDRALDYAGLNALLDLLLPSKNLLYAIRIDGDFDYVRTRSVPRQESYRPLVEVAREQPEFEFHDIQGTLAGFWSPSFMQSLTVPGYHLHFLTADRSSGGHLLECRSRRVRVAIQHVPRLEVGLPVTLDYLTADFTRDMKRDLDEAER